MQTISITVSGKVQGVYYRQSTKEKALALNIIGTVENLKNGDVYIVATGTTEQLEALKIWCHVGPSSAIVDKAEVSELPLQLFEKFSVKR